jgi:hypothetical protein
MIMFTNTIRILSLVTLASLSQLGELRAASQCDENYCTGQAISCLNTFQNDPSNDIKATKTLDNCLNRIENSNPGCSGLNILTDKQESKYLVKCPGSQGTPVEFKG